MTFLCTGSYTFPQSLNRPLEYCTSSCRQEEGILYPRQINKSALNDKGSDLHMSWLLITNIQCKVVVNCEWYSNMASKEHSIVSLPVRRKERWLNRNFGGKGPGVSTISASVWRQEVFRWNECVHCSKRRIRFVDNNKYRQVTFWYLCHSLIRISWKWGLKICDICTVGGVDDLISSLLILCFEELNKCFPFKASR